MAIRTDTYAFVRSVPYLLERGAAQTIYAPIRHGATGALVAPTSGTVVVAKPDGTTLSSGPAVVASSQATYDITPSSSLALGEGYEVRWTLIFSGTTYPVYRQAAYMCEYVPPNLISANELYARIPELKHRIPQSQGTSGDNVGWQPQIDEAYYELIRRLIDDARRPWLIREVTGYRDWLMARTLQLAVGAINAGPSGDWAQKSKELAFERRDAEGRMRIQYSVDDPTVRRGGRPLVRLAPVGRPSW